MNLNIKNWKEFKIKDLFEVSGTKTTKLEDLEMYGIGQYPYVTTQATNNGVAGFFNYYTEQGNVLTIDSAVLGFCSYHEDNFSASDHVEKLTPKFEMNNKIAFFIVTILNREIYRYSYGRKSNQIKINNTTIKLPILMDKDLQPIIDTTNKYSKDGYIPDWQFMEDYIKSINHKPITTKNRGGVRITYSWND